jgi:hypothetical protein
MREDPNVLSFQRSSFLPHPFKSVATRDYRGWQAPTTRDRPRGVPDYPSWRMVRAAFQPGAPITPPPGWAAEPQR